MAVVPPPNYDDAVALLPAGQDPYGAKCALSTIIQSVFFHYHLRQSEADLFAKEGFTTLQMLQEAHPDGSAGQRKLYTGALEGKIDGLLWRRLAGKAVRRLLSGKPLAKRDAPPPPPPPAAPSLASSHVSKKAKLSGTAAVTVPSTPTSASTSASTSAAAAAAVVVEVSDDEEDGDDFYSDHDSDGADHDGAAKNDDVVSSKESLSALFADCSTEVCSVRAGSGVACLYLGVFRLLLAFGWTRVVDCMGCHCCFVHRKFGAPRRICWGNVEYT